MSLLATCFRARHAVKHEANRFECHATARIIERRKEGNLYILLPVVYPRSRCAPDSGRKILQQELVKTSSERSRQADVLTRNFGVHERLSPGHKGASPSPTVRDTTSRRFLLRQCKREEIRKQRPDGSQGASEQNVCRKHAIFLGMQPTIVGSSLLLLGMTLASLSSYMRALCIHASDFSTAFLCCLAYWHIGVNSPENTLI